MIVRYYFLLFCVFFSLRLGAQEVIYSDFAVFRLENQTYMNSHVLSAYKALKFFNCLESNSLLLNGLDLKSDFFQNESLDLSKAQISKIVVLKKLEDLVKKQMTTKKSFSPKRYGASKCGELASDEDLEFKTLLDIESFLHDRFLSRVKESGNQPHMTFSLPEKNSVRLYLNSLDKQVKHSFYDKLQ